MKICPNCGAPNLNDSQFCESCGGLLKLQQKLSKSLKSTSSVLLVIFVITIIFAIITFIGFIAEGNLITLIALISLLICMLGSYAGYVLLNAVGNIHERICEIEQQKNPTQRRKINNN